MCCASLSILVSDELSHLYVLNHIKAWLMEKIMGVMGPHVPLHFCSIAWDQSHGSGLAPRERAEARKCLTPRLRIVNNTSATSHWLKQVTRLAQKQKVGKYTVHVVEMS